MNISHIKIITTKVIQQINSLKHTESSLHFNWQFYKIDVAGQNGIQFLTEVDSQFPFVSTREV